MGPLETLHKGLQCSSEILKTSVPNCGLKMNYTDRCKCFQTTMLKVLLSSYPDIVMVCCGTKQKQFFIFRATPAKQEEAASRAANFVHDYDSLREQLL